MNTLLLRTPKPHALESYRGYLLRLSEVNGLSSPAPVLKLAGVSMSRLRCAEQPVEVLSVVTGHDINLLAHLPLEHPVSNIQQVSGHAVSKGYSIISKAKICPCCIKEQGYAPAYWDLIAVQGCYKHKQTLISICPQCKTDLSHSRQGLLICQCGADLSELTGEPMSLEYLEFLKLIEAKFLGQVLENSESLTGLPFKHLSEISISNFLAIMHTIGSMQLLLDCKVARAKACTHKDEINYALEVMKDWPNNFFKFMHRVGEQYGRKTRGLDGQFGFFTHRFFKRGYPYQDIKFLKEAFVKFGQDHWSKAGFYPRVKEKSEAVNQSNFLGVRDFAELVGHSPSAVRKMIKEGSLVAKKLEGSKIGKIIIDIEKSKIVLPDVGNAMSEVEAGKFTGLPLSVIRSLRKLKIIGINLPAHLKFQKKLLCKEDIQALKQKIIACQQNTMPSEQLISIEFVMCKPFRSNTLKSVIIEKILDGSLECFGCAKELPEIKIRVVDLEVLSGCVNLEECDLISIKQTSSELHCDKWIILMMLQQGLLEGEADNGVYFVNKQSVLNFKQKYITLQQLSFAFELGVKSLNYLCEQHGVVLFTVKSKFNVCQNFIERSAVSILANHVREYYLNHKKLAYRCRLESIDFSWVA